MNSSQRQPLAHRMRPRNLTEFYGQRHLLAADKPLQVAIESMKLHSMILWGPPGTGKTTLARMIAELCEVRFESLSAVLSGVKEVREAIARAEATNRSGGPATLLFIDEVHRFNKNQQDAFLPHVESGAVVFIGATTENPTFELNNALLSRTRIYRFNPLEAADLVLLVKRACSDDEYLRDMNLTIAEESIQRLVSSADGDARMLLNLLEVAVDLSGTGHITDATVREVLSTEIRQFDKRGDIFFEQISALHKAVRGSSPDAAVYWFARMIDGGCDPLYIARRVVRMASEDIGNADPRALDLAINAYQTQERLGTPEGHLALAQAVIYLASAPKSNAVYRALSAVEEDVRTKPSYPVPAHLRNASTQLMREQGFGDDYRYAHDYEGAYVAGESYLPRELVERNYYDPAPRGLEIRIGEKLAQLKELDRQSEFQRYGAAAADLETGGQD